MAGEGKDTKGMEDEYKTFLAELGGKDPRELGGSGQTRTPLRIPHVQLYSLQDVFHPQCMPQVHVLSSGRQLSSNQVLTPSCYHCCNKLVVYRASMQMHFSPSCEASMHM